MDTKENVSIPTLSSRSYDVIIGQNTLERVGDRLRELFETKRVTMISNDTVWENLGNKVSRSLQAAALDHDLIVVPEGEAFKSLDSTAAILDALIDCGARRQDPIVALGGGVIGDLSGFVASVYLRGVPFVNLPTTLLAMVDSSVGGKTGVDTPAGKNLVGSFYQPALVIADIDSLVTLPEREVRTGLAEAIKTALLAGEGLRNWLATNLHAILKLDSASVQELVRQCVRYKGDIVAEDEFDNLGKRAALNYGHTLAHALETAGSYGNLNHGEAVAVGLVFAAVVGEKIGVSASGTVHSTKELLKMAGLPTCPGTIPEAEVIKIMQRDKKNTDDSINLVLLQDMGRPVMRPVPVAIIKEALKELTND